jgi:hypothetical protein
LHKQYFTCPKLVSLQRGVLSGFRLEPVCNQPGAASSGLMAPSELTLQSGLSGSQQKKRKQPMIREAIAICAILLLCACGAESKGDATTSSGTIQALVDGADIEFICVVDIVFS